MCCAYICWAHSAFGAASHDDGSTLYNCDPLNWFRSVAQWSIKWSTIAGASIKWIRPAELIHWNACHRKAEQTVVSGPTLDSHGDGWYAVKGLDPTDGISLTLASYVLFLPIQSPSWFVQMRFAKQSFYKHQFSMKIGLHSFSITCQIAVNILIQADVCARAERPSKHHCAAGGRRGSCRTCLLISAPAWTSHSRHSGWPPNAAMWVGVCANLEVTAFTSQPIWTSCITHSSCIKARQTNTETVSVQWLTNANRQENPGQVCAGWVQ